MSVRVRRELLEHLEHTGYSLANIALQPLSSYPGPRDFGVFTVALMPLRLYPHW